MLRDEGRVTLVRRGSALAVWRLSGVIERIHVQWLLDELERGGWGAAATLFVDASRLTLLSVPAGHGLSEWLAAHRHALAAVHVLVGEAPFDPQLETLGPILHRWHEAEPFLVALRDHGG